MACEHNKRRACPACMQKELVNRLCARIEEADAEISALKSELTALKTELAATYRHAHELANAAAKFSGDYLAVKEAES